MPSILIQCVFLLLTLFAENSYSQIGIQFSGEPSQFDPLMMEDGLALRLAANVIATPFEYSNRGKLTPLLVEHYTVDQGSTRFDLKFRPGLVWSDGVDFHVDQFVLALKRMSQAKIKTALSELFPKVDFQKVKIKSPIEVEIVLKESAPAFLDWCTLPPFAPIREDLIRKYESSHTPVVPTLAAYRVSTYVRDDHLLLEKNKNYFDAKNIQIGQVKLWMMREESGLYPLLKSGKIDILTKIPPLQFEKIKAVASVVDVPVFATTYLGFNVRKSPFNEVMNRRLFRDRLEKEKSKLADLLKTGEIAAHSFLPLDLLGAEPILNGNAVGDSTLAQKVGSAPASIVLQSDSGSRNQTILEFTQGLFRDQRLWNVQLQTLDWREHMSKLKSMQSGDSPNLYRIGWQNPILDPAVFYEVLKSTNENNFTGWKSSDYDKRVEDLKKIPNDPKHLKQRIQAMQSCERWIGDQVPIIPLLHQVLKFAYSKRVSGFHGNPFGVILFRELRLAPL